MAEAARIQCERCESVYPLKNGKKHPYPGRPRLAPDEEVMFDELIAKLTGSSTCEC